MNTDWITDSLNEVVRARQKFPSPDLLTTAFAEEAGELVKAILDGFHGKPSNVYEEAIQVIAMVVRLIEEGDPVHRLEPKDLRAIGGDIDNVSFDPTFMERFQFRGYNIVELNHIIVEHERRLRSKDGGVETEWDAMNEAIIHARNYIESDRKEKREWKGWTLDEFDAACERLDKIRTEKTKA